VSQKNKKKEERRKKKRKRKEERKHPLKFTTAYRIYIACQGALFYILKRKEYKKELVQNSCLGPHGVWPKKQNSIYK